MKNVRSSYWKEKKGTIGVIVTIITAIIAIGFTYVLSQDKVSKSIVEHTITYRPYVKQWIIISSVLVLGYIIYLIFDVIKFRIKLAKKEEEQNQITLSEIENKKKEIENLHNIKLQDQIQNLKIDLEKERAKNKQPVHIHKRFEYIIKKKLKYVAIDYKPFFWEKTVGLKDYPQGIGYELMSKIFEPFNVELIDETPAEGYSWKTIFEDFSEKRRDKLDFIMTPMYETRTRLFNYNVIYTIPLFYSDIGIYVRKNDETQNMKLAFDDALYQVASGEK